MIRVASCIKVVFVLMGVSFVANCVSATNEKIVNVNYHSAYRNLQPFQYESRYSTGQKLTKAEADTRNSYFVETVYNDGAKTITHILEKEVNAELYFDVKGMLVSSVHSKGTCNLRYGYESIKFSCFSKLGNNKTEYVQYYVKGVLSKTEYINDKGALVRFSIYDYVDDYEYHFLASGEFVKREKLVGHGIPYIERFSEL